MHDNIPSDDSILLSDGIIGEDVKLLLLNKVFSEIVNGDMVKDEEEKEKELE